MTTMKERFDLHNKEINALLENFQNEQQDIIYTSMSLGKQLESVANILNVHIPNHMDNRYVHNDRIPHYRDVYSFNISKRYENMHEIVANLRAEVKAMRELYYHVIGEHEDMKAILRDEEVDPKNEEEEI